MASKRSSVSSMWPVGGPTMGACHGAWPAAGCGAGTAVERRRFENRRPAHPPLAATTAAGLACHPSSSRCSESTRPSKSRTCAGAAAPARRRLGVRQPDRPAEDAGTVPVDRETLAAILRLAELGLAHCDEHATSTAREAKPQPMPRADRPGMPRPVPAPCPAPPRRRRSRPPYARPYAGPSECSYSHLGLRSGTWEVRGCLVGGAIPVRGGSRTRVPVRCLVDLAVRGEFHRRTAA